jgi:hypothetical protein
MSALLMLVTRDDGHAFRDLDNAEIHRDHQRQQHRELDRRDAAAIPREGSEALDKLRG